MHVETAKMQAQGTALIGGGLIGRTLLGAGNRIVQAFRAGGWRYAATATMPEQILLAEMAGTAVAVATGAELPPTPLSPAVQGAKAGGRALPSVTSQAVGAEVDALGPAIQAIDDVPPPPMAASTLVESQNSTNVNREVLIYRHKIKPNKETDLVELNRQLKDQEADCNKIIQTEGMPALKARINNYRTDPYIEREGRRIAAALPPAAPNQAHLHAADMGVGGLPADIVGQGGKRENSILGGQVPSRANEILAMPDTTNCIECRLEIIDPNGN